MLWIKTLHIVFVTGWFAALFYAPRLFVNLAMVPGGSQAEFDRLTFMAGKLIRFGQVLMWGALFFGMWLWWGYGIGGGWLHAKLGLVLLLVIYQFWMQRHLRLWQHTQPGLSPHNHRWYRWVNEIPVLFLLTIVALVVFKPF